MCAVNRLLALSGLAVAVSLLHGCRSVNLDGTLRGRNVLLIVADDLNCSIGSFGDSSAVTPHLDNLSEQGVRFSEAHCQYPLCGPSRTSFLTGLYPSQSGVRENRILLREALPDVVTLPQLFRMHGYEVVRIGKLFHYDNPGEIGTAGQDDNPSWDETYNPSGRDKREEHLINSLVEGKFGGTLSWYRSLGEDMEYTDGMVAQIAADKLDEFAKSGAPFFFGGGLFPPSHPFFGPCQIFRPSPRGRDCRAQSGGGGLGEAASACPEVFASQSKPTECPSRHRKAGDSGVPRIGVICGCPSGESAGCFAEKRIGQEYFGRLLERPWVSPRRAWTLAKANLVRAGYSGSIDSSQANRARGRHECAVAC